MDTAGHSAVRHPSCGGLRIHAKEVRKQWRRAVWPVRHVFLIVSAPHLVLNGGACKSRDSRINRFARPVLREECLVHVRRRGNPSYPKMIAELKQERKLGRRCGCRTCPYLNNVVEQDHRAIKRRVNASQGFRSLDGAWRTIQGYEVLHMIREGQVRWLPKEDVVGQIQFIQETLGLKS